MPDKAQVKQKVGVVAEAITGIATTRPSQAQVDQSVGELMPGATAVGMNYGQLFTGPNSLQIESGPHWPILIRPTRPAIPLVGRDKLIHEAREALARSIRDWSQDVEVVPSSKRSSACVVLRGLPGVGKSAIAATLSYELQTESLFSGGVLWAYLGCHDGSSESRDNSLHRAVHDWARKLKIPIGEFGSEMDLPSKVDIIRSHIGNHRVLLVIDDPWHAEDATVLMEANGGCGTIVTTRDKSVAMDIPGTLQKEVEPLGNAASVEMLSTAAPAVAQLARSNDPSGAAEKEVEALLVALARKSGGLPLAICLIARSLQSVSGAGRLKPVLAIMKSLDELFTVSWVPGRPVRVEPLPKRGNRDASWVAEAAVDKLDAVIRHSERRLQRGESQLLGVISVFPAEPNTFSLEAAKFIAETDEPSGMDNLVSSGLVDVGDGERYSMHPAIVNYARRQLRPETKNLAETKMVDFFARLLTEHGRSIDQTETEQANVMEALRIAREAKLIPQFVRSVNAFFSFIEARGLYVHPEVVGLLNATVASAAELKESTEWAKALLNRAHTEEKEARYLEAEQTLKHSLEHGVVAGEPGLLADIHLTIAVVRYSCCKYADADAALREALRHLEKLPQPDLLRQCEIHRRLAEVALARGQIDEAESRFNLAFNAAMTAELEAERLTGILLCYGVLQFQRREFYTAHASLKMSLRLAEGLGHGERIVAARHMLAAVQHNRDDMCYDEAVHHLAEAERLAAALRHSWYLSAVRSEWGELALKRGDLSTAAEHFNRAAAACPAQSDDRRAFAIFGRARVHQRAGELDKACACGETSFRLFNAISHGSERPVRFWLVALYMDIAEEHYRARDLDSAERIFTLAKDTASESQPDQTAFALYGLARVAEARHDRELSRRLGHDCLTIFDRIGHPKSVEVRRWLVTLLHDQAKSKSISEELKDLLDQFSFSSAHAQSDLPLPKQTISPFSLAGSHTPAR